MPSPSYIDIIDTISPLVTLAFGVYCAVNDTKPKDGKLSKAGKIALWGLIISGLITLLVKFDSLQKKLEEEQEKIAEQKKRLEEQEKQRIEKQFRDSLNAAFENATSDTLSKTVRELNTIRSASKTTLHSLTVVADKQQAALENTRRGLHPLFPLQVSLDYFIDINEVYRKNQSSYHHKKDIGLYLDTLVHFATKAKIPGLLYRERHSGIPADTVNIPKVMIIDPLQNHTYPQIPADVNIRFNDAKNYFVGWFLTPSFNINLRKKNNSKSRLILKFSVGDLITKIQKGEASNEENERLETSVDMNTKLLHVKIKADNPEIVLDGQTNEFISLYDLQNSIMGINLGNSLNNDPSILKLNEISINTGHQFSRRTTFKFSDRNIRERCCNETYTRFIKPEEIE